MEAAARVRDDGHENELVFFLLEKMKKCGVISCQGVGLSQEDTHAVEPTTAACV